jgi:S-DNA-T family DNA segregation ATPase FtsK/SpoIIIE
LNPLESNDESVGWSFDYYSCNAYQSSVFPFRILSQPIWNGINDLLDKEEVNVQVLFTKPPQEKIADALWTQYEDYVNGIEYPTSNVIIRAIQQRILETMRKIEGGYRKHERITESEKKLQEELFKVEIRFAIAADSEHRRKVLFNKVTDVIGRHCFINSWAFNKESDKALLEHMRLRRFSLFRNQQYLSSSELAGLFLTEEVQEMTTKNIPATKNNDTPIEVEDRSVFAAFPYGQKLSRDDDYKIAGVLNKALMKLGLINDEEVIVQKIQQGATVKRVTFTLPEGLKLTKLKNAIADIQTELAMTDVGILQGSSAGTAVLSIPQKEREMVFVRDCVEDEEFQKFVKTAFLPLLIGQSETGEVVFADLVNIKHLLIAGASGSGKSIFITSLLTVLLTLISPSDLKVYLVDPKMVELAPFAKYPHVQQVFTVMNEVESVLSFLCDKMDERYEKFKEKGYKKIEHYNRNESVKIPYILLVIDELADLIIQFPDSENFIIRLAQKARAAGILMIIATQKPLKTVLTSLIKGNMLSRVCFACDSGVSYRVALDMTPDGFTLLGKGDGVYKFEGIQGLHRFQGALMAKTEEEQDLIIETQSRHWKVKGNKEIIDIATSKSNKEARELTDFKKFVLESGETRITELKKLLNMRNEKIRDLMQKLIDLGWVKQHKSKQLGFEFLLSEEERKRELERLR